jgi:hypothetical protein
MTDSGQVLGERRGGAGTESVIGDAARGGWGNDWSVIRTTQELMPDGLLVVEEEIFPTQFAHFSSTSKGRLKYPNTALVLSKIWRSLIPARSHISFIGTKPPLMNCTTSKGLILTLTWL